MLKKRAEYQITDVTPLNVPSLPNIIKDQELEVDPRDTQETVNLIKEANNKSAVKRMNSDNPSFDLEAEIKDHPDSLFVKVFAIKAGETNDNGDHFSKEELIKSYQTFVGVPLFTNHQNSDVEQARGKVVHSWWDENKNGIMIIGRVDAEAYPQLARAVKEKYVLGTSMGCLTAKCRVLMEDGTYLPISEVQPGDFVYTHFGNIKEVLNTQIRTKKEFIRHIKFEGYGSTLEITKNHKVLTLKKYNYCACGCGKELPKYKKDSHRNVNWKNKYRKRFINGHSQHVWNSNSKKTTYSLQLKKDMQNERQFTKDDLEWVESGKLSIGDVALFPIKKDKYRKNKDCTIEKARLIGYFLAEGCFSRRNKELYSVTFSYNITEQNTYGKETIELLKKAFPGCRPCGIKRQSGNVYLVVVRNKQIAEWFYKYCGEYSFGKKIHQKVFNWPDKYIKHILGAYINGDGCFSTRSPDSRNGSINQSIDIATVSHDLASQIHFLLKRIGIYSRCHAEVGDKYAEVKLAVGAPKVLVGRNFFGENRELSVRPSFWINISGSFVHKIRKYTNCLGLIKKNRNNNNMRFINIYSNKDHKSNKEKLSYLLRPIKEIKDVYYEGSVYNLQIKDDNSYVSEDMAVKNCQVQYSLCSICHNYAETPDEYCTHIKERKTRKLSGTTKCIYKKHGPEDSCPICGATKSNSKALKYNDLQAFEYNYGIKFIENSFVVNPACSDCGVTEVIDPNVFLQKAADIAKRLPKLLKAAASHNLMCDDKKCIKVAGQKEIEDLNQALDMITSVSKTILSQKDQIDLEFLSDLVKVLADLQKVTDELTQQGYGRLPSTEEQQQQHNPLPGEKNEITNAVPQAAVEPNSVGAPQVTSGPAGPGTVTGPLASIREFNLNKYSSFKKRRSKIKVGLEWKRPKSIL